MPGRHARMPCTMRGANSSMRHLCIALSGIGSTRLSRLRFCAGQGMELERELMADSTSDSESEATTSGRIAYTPKRARGGKASGSGSSSRSSLSIKHGKGGGRNSYSARGRPRGSAVAGAEVDRAVEAVSQEVRTLIPQVQALRQRYNQLLMQRSSSTSTQQLPGAGAAAANPAATAAAGPSCSSPRVPTAGRLDIDPVTAAALPASAVPDSCRMLKAEACAAIDTATAACAAASCLLPTPSQPEVPRLATLGRPIPSAIIQDITAAAAVAAAAAAAADHHGIPEPDEDMADLADEELLLDPRHSLAVPPEYCQVEHHALLHGRASPSIAPGAPGCTLLTPRGAGRSCCDPEDGMDAEEAAELFAGLDSPKDLLLARLTPPPRQLLPHTMLPHHLPESAQAVMYLPPWKGAPCGPRGTGAGASEAACSSAHVKKEDLGAGCHTAASRAFPPRGGLLEYQGSANSTLHSSLSTTLHLRRASSTADSDGDEEHMLHHPHTLGLPRSCLGQGDALPFHGLPHPAWDEAGMYYEEPGMALGLPLHGWEHCGQYADPYAFARPLGGSPGEPVGNMYEYAYIDVTLVDPDEV